MKLADETGATIGEGGVLCVATLKRLHPELSFNEACVYMRSDAARKAEFDAAREAVAEEEASRADAVLPLFIPWGEVRRDQIFGHEVYVKAALFSESELTNKLGASPADLNQKPFKCELKQPGEVVNFYTVSLAGTSAEERAACRKIKIFSATHAEHSHCYINQQTQLSKEQPERAFSHVARQVGDTRPEKMMSMQLPTLEELKEQAARLEERSFTSGPKGLSIPVGSSQ